MAKTRPIVIRMPDDLYQAIKAKAAREERSMAQQIRHVLRVHTGLEAVDGQPSVGDISGSG